MPQHIIIVSNNPRWNELFEREAAKIKEILDTRLIAIYHIGSTSVPLLKAKPIIDIMPVVNDISKVDLLNPQFTTIGYECLGEYGIPGRRFFRKGGDERTHHIHLFEHSNKKDIERHLAVRNYLRTHKKIADQYGQLKSELAEKYPYNIEGYCDGKDAFVKNMEQAALQWYDLGTHKI